VQVVGDEPILVGCVDGGGATVVKGLSICFDVVETRLF